jgi:multicomponent Na+:H+ antiporter subunit G
VNLVAEVLLVLGCALILVAAIGVTRFQDALARMHALTKATMLGLVLVLLGATIGIDDVNAATFAGLTVALQVLTTPVSSNLIARATYRAEQQPGGPAADDPEIDDSELGDPDVSGTGSGSAGA